MIFLLFKKRNKIVFIAQVILLIIIKEVVGNTFLLTDDKVKGKNNFIDI